MAVERLQTPGNDVWQSCYGDHLARYEFAARYAAGRKVLDAGTGIGYGALFLAHSGAEQVIGLDLDSVSVDSARTMFRAPNLSYVVGDCETLATVDGPFDLICNFENIKHLQRPEEFLRNAATRLTPNGLLLCSTPDRATTPPFKNGRPANPYHVHEWYREEFREMLGRHFGSVQMFVQVKSYAQARREEVAAVFASHAAIQSSFLVRGMLKVGRTLRLAGADCYPRPLKPGVDTGVGEPTSYPIVPEAVVPLYGTPMCHVAVCRYKSLAG